MATRTAIALEDDLDGGPADQTMRFRFGTTEYEIDLNTKNASRFRALLAPFLEHARKASRGTRRPARPSSARQPSAGIRAWAKEHDIAVSARGRIPAGIIEQYEAAVTAS